MSPQMLDAFGRSKTSSGSAAMVDVYSARPSASDLPNGTRFYALDFGQEYVVSSGAWVPKATAPEDVQRGVIAAGDGALTRNSATSITIAAGSAWVTDANGILVRVSWGSTGLTVRNPGTTALDQVIVSSAGVVSIQQGSLQAAATLDNRTGADDAGIGTGKLRLYDLNPTTGNSGISVAGYRDRRPWARGAHYYETYTSGVNCQTNGAILKTFALECSGAPLRVRLVGAEFLNSTGGNQTPSYSLRLDGTRIQGGSLILTATGVAPPMPAMSTVVIPSAGRHTVGWYNDWNGDNSGSNQYRPASGAVGGMHFGAEEIVRQTSANTP